jgi:hypothetical protein
VLVALKLHGHGAHVLASASPPGQVVIVDDVRAFHAEGRTPQWRRAAPAAPGLQFRPEQFLLVLQNMHRLYWGRQSDCTSIEHRFGRIEYPCALFFVRCHARLRRRSSPEEE